MRKTKIADLKNRLSYLLDRVKRGETILVRVQNFFPHPRSLVVTLIEAMTYDVVAR